MRQIRLLCLFHSIVSEDPVAVNCLVNVVYQAVKIKICSRVEAAHEHFIIIRLQVFSKPHHLAVYAYQKLVIDLPGPVRRVAM